MSFQRLSEGVEGSPGRRSPGGRSFHSRGPAAEKLLSPSLLGLCVRGTSSFRMSLELDRSGRRPTSDRRHALPWYMVPSANTSLPPTSPNGISIGSAVFAGLTSHQCTQQRDGIHKAMLWGLKRPNRDAVWAADSRGLKKPCTRWGAHRRHLANTIKRSVHGGDAALYQVNVITCYIPLNPV